MAHLEPTYAELSAKVADLKEENDRYMSMFCILTGSETIASGKNVAIVMTAKEFEELEALSEYPPARLIALQEKLARAEAGRDEQKRVVKAMRVECARCNLFFTDEQIQMMKAKATEGS